MLGKDIMLTEEQRIMYDQIQNFATKEIAPGAIERDEREEFSHENWKKMADMGLLGLPYPEEYGGGAADAVTHCLAAEAFARGRADAGCVLSWGASTILCGIPIWKLGTEEQKQKYLPRLSNGEMIGGFCLSEPGSGSDAASMQTRAVKKGDKYILNGAKMWITNGPQGDVFVVTAKTAPEQKAFGISTFLVESTFPGFKVGKKLHKLGNRSSPTSEIFFEDCEVPAENLLGQENFGFVQTAKLILGYERTCLVAPTVGGLEAGLDACAQYATERKQFGKPIGYFDAIKAKLAYFRMMVEVNRSSLLYAAWLLDQGKDNLVEAAVSKILCTEAALQAADHGIQIHGGYGYIKEFRVESGWRDAKLGTIGGGTSEVQRSIIARSLVNLGY